MSPFAGSTVIDDEMNQASPTAPSGDGFRRAAPELALLILIARVESPALQSDRLLELLARPLRWGYLVALAEHHGLQPLMLHHLSPFEDLVPADVLRQLRESGRLVALRNLRLSAALHRISAHLNSLGIEHIAYKGPLLAEIYGGNGSLRVYRDLDLLVPQTKLAAVRDALAAIGFRDALGLTESQQAASFVRGFEHSFSSADGIDVDVHWRIVQEFKSPGLDMPGLWSRRVEATLLDRKLPALSPEDLLVVLCLHAGHHGWMQLSHLCDLAQLFAVHKSLDWSIVRSHLGDSNTRRIVCLTLHLLGRHWKVEADEEMAYLMAADPHVTRLADVIEREIWPSLRPDLTTSNFRWLLDRSKGENWRDRLRLVAGSLFVPAGEDIAMLDLSPTLSFLYAGLRAFRIAARYVSSIGIRHRPNETKRPGIWIEQL